MCKRFAVVKIVKVKVPFINSYGIVDETDGVRGEILDSFEKQEEAFSFAKKQKNKVYVHDYEEHRDYSEKDWKNDIT